MSNFSVKHGKVLKLIEEELHSLNIEYERNGVELIFAQCEFNFESTIDAFKDGSAKKMLSDWKLPARKKQRQEPLSTSTLKSLPKKLESSTAVSKCVSPSPEVPNEQPNSLSPENKSSWIIYDRVNQDIARQEELIKQYESKMESCNDKDLRDYYKNSAIKVREQIGVSLKLCGAELSKSEQINELSAKFERMSTNVGYLLEENRYRTRAELDCWDQSSTRTRSDQDEFKNNLILYYKCGSVKKKTIKCMIMNRFFKRNLVRAVHIWKFATHGIGLSRFQLKESNVHDERNGLLLYESIKQAFDTKKICFIYDPFSGVLRLKLLFNNMRSLFVVDDEQLRKTYNEHRTFADIDGTTLALPKDVYPYRRLLNCHGRCAYSTAKARNWINSNENLEDFFHLSDLISLPGDAADE